MKVRTIGLIDDYDGAGLRVQRRPDQEPAAAARFLLSLQGVNVGLAEGCCGGKQAGVRFVEPVEIVLDAEPGKDHGIV